MYMNKLGRFLLYLHNMYVCYTVSLNLIALYHIWRSDGTFVYRFPFETILLEFYWKRFAKSFLWQAIDKNTRIDLKTCSSTSSRAQHSVVCAFQRVRLKVNGEATHSQDFLSVGRSVGSVSPRCAYGHRACAIERPYARKHARAIAGSCACAHVHFARARKHALLFK